MLSNRDRNIQFIRNPHLKHLELRWSRYRQHAFDKHTHDTYSIGVVLTGQTNFFHHHHPQLIGSGAIALINPDEVHACNPQKGSTLSYGMLYVEPGLIQEVTSSLSGQEAGIAHFTSPVINDAQLFFDLNDLCLLITHGVAGFEVESKLYEILARLLQRYSDVKSRTEQFEASRTRVERGRL